ncbi:MAG: hypothetical protein WC341_15025 [Bacteroidales bacterium]
MPIIRSIGAIYNMKFAACRNTHSSIEAESLELTLQYELSNVGSGISVGNGWVVITTGAGAGLKFWLSGVAITGAIVTGGCGACTGWYRLICTCTASGWWVIATKPNEKITPSSTTAIT